MTTSNIIDNCQKFILSDPGSGHRMTIVNFTSNMITKASYPKPLWNFKKANWPGFSDTLEKLLVDISQDISPYELSSLFNKSLIESAKKNIPRGCLSKYKPFWNVELSEQRKTRDAARVEAERLEGKTAEERRQAVIEWRRQCAIMKRKIIEAKRKSWNGLLNAMDYRTHGEKAYKLLNNLNNKKKDLISHPMLSGGSILTDPRSIAEKFNKHFLNKYVHMKQKWQSERYKNNGTDLTEAEERIFHDIFSIEELKGAIKNLKVKKQPGPDNIFPEFLKHMGPTAQNTLLKIYNIFWTKNINVPSDWDKAVIIPIHKKDKPTEDFDSYRPIALTSILAKTFERMVTTRLNFFLESAEILEEEQAGFRNGMSTSNSIMKFVHVVKSGFNTKKSSLAVFVDFQGAYDTICRKKLQSKLSVIGITGRMLSWIEKFLAQRWVKTRWNNINSKYQQSKIGLPQGSVSSSTLFNIYVNDLIKVLKNVGDI